MNILDEVNKVFKRNVEPTVEEVIEEPTPVPYEVEIVPNPNMRNYHTNFEISKSHIQIFYRPLRESTGGYLIEVGRKGATIVRRLFKIPGVTEVFVHPYSLGIKKGKCFKWDEIEPKVIEVIMKSAPKPK
ncbi:MAG: NifU N-terminal domain-containing protein [Candidatus Dojkabacteria bacterium]|nr:NifU N-terminal domain-containing protein [Candidatus Dojkabacteria bacterium]